MCHSRPLYCLFQFFQWNLKKVKVVDFSQIQTRSIGVEGKYDDHMTTITALKYICLHRGARHQIERCAHRLEEKTHPWNTNFKGSIAVWLTSCLFCLDSAALLMLNKQHFYLTHHSYTRGKFRCSKVMIVSSLTSLHCWMLISNSFSGWVESQSVKLVYSHAVTHSITK